MVSLGRHSALTAAISVVLGSGIVGTAQAVGRAAISMESSTVWASMVADAHFDVSAPLGLPRGSAVGLASLTSLTGVAPDAHLEAPVGAVSFVSHAPEVHAGGLDLSIASTHETAAVDVAPLGSLLGPEQPGPSFEFGGGASMWTASAPEPMTYVLMLMSLGVVGWLKLRGR
jgi:hypothetical protein